MKFEYSFPTGEVFTDSDNLAAVFYDIKQIETTSAFVSEDREEMDEMLGEAYAQIVDMLVYLGRYVKECSEEIDTTLTVDIESDFREISEECCDAREDDIQLEQMQATLKSVYPKLLQVIPKLKKISVEE